MTHAKYFSFGVPYRPPIEAVALAPIHAPRQCCLRECFIISLAKALALQLPLLPRTIALAVHLLRLLCKQSLIWQVISVILFAPFCWQLDSILFVGLINIIIGVVI